jgi:hypothetical protein
MAWQDRVQSEIDRLVGIRTRKGGLGEDRRFYLAALEDVQKWAREDKEAARKDLPEDLFAAAKRKGRGC